MDRNRIRRREAGGEDRDAEEDKERRTRVREMESYDTGVELLSSLFSLKAYDSHTQAAGSQPAVSMCGSVPPEDTALTVRDQLFQFTLLPNLARGR